MTPEEFARDSWQSGGSAAPLPPLEELRARADKFHRTIARRNWLEYAVGIVLIATFGSVLLFGPLPWHDGPTAVVKLASALALVGVAVVMWQLHHRAAPLSPPEHGGQLSVLEFQRRELVRQRDALKSVLLWYLAPLVPGLLVFMAGPLLAGPLDQWEWPSLGSALRLLVAPAIFVGVWWINQLAAGMLQREIDEIDALKAE